MADLIFSLPLVLSGLYHINRVLVGKEYAVTILKLLVTHFLGQRCGCKSVVYELICFRTLHLPIFD